jgi:hypothetical protein
MEMVDEAMSGVVVRTGRQEIGMPGSQLPINDRVRRSLPSDRFIAGIAIFGTASQFRIAKFHFAFFFSSL